MVQHLAVSRAPKPAWTPPPSGLAAAAGAGKAGPSVGRRPRSRLPACLPRPLASCSRPLHQNRPAPSRWAPARLPVLRSGYSFGLECHYLDSGALAQQSEASVFLDTSRAANSAQLDSKLWEVTRGCP